MTQVLCELVQSGVEASYVGLAYPHLYEGVPGLLPEILICPQVHSDAITDKGTLYTAQLSENIIRAVREKYSERAEITIWGTYLFPFAHAALIAKQALISDGYKVRLVVSPAGSDIWQLGPHLRNTAEHILFAPEVDGRLTYTRQFAEEINGMFGRSAEIATIYPIMDTQRFRPVTAEEKLRRRGTLGIHPEDFVVCCHCNMRPVKRPEVVMEIARRASAEMGGRRLLLLMVGPLADLLREAGEVSTSQYDYFEVKSTDVVSRVEDFLTVSDVELNWSAHDSFCGSLMEAMGCGLPVVSTEVVGIGPEVLASGCGRLFHDGDISGAASFISSLGLDEQLRSTMASNAARHAAKVFSTDTLLPKYLDILFPATAIGCL